MTIGMQRATQKYGEPVHVTCTLPSLDFPPIRVRRFGEVVMCIRRLDGTFLLHTKASYPGAVMRLPSGGINRGEDLETALLREIQEETSLTVQVREFAALLEYTDDRTRAAFRSHLFLVDETAGELICNDPGEQITEWGHSATEELAGYADKLRALQPDWYNWGLFRAASLDTLAEYLAATQPKT